MQQLPDTLYKALYRRLSVIVLCLTFLMVSCSEELDNELLPQEMTVTEEKMSPELLEYFDNVQRDIIGDPNQEPVLPGCRAGLIFRDFAGTTSSQAVPFYQSATLQEATRADGLCNFPSGLNRPCLFIGTVTIQNTSGLSGNYRVLSPWVGGTIYNYSNVNSSFTFAYGRPQLPTAILCGTIGDFIFQAQDAVTGGWVNVALLRLTCSNCTLQPFDGEEPTG